jgi:hypothetical protein
MRDKETFGKSVKIARKSSNTNKNDSHGNSEVTQSRGGRQSASEW